MSVFFRLHQDQSVGTKKSGKWYARAVPMATINTRQLAEIIQRNCTVKKSDVLAVLDELVETMREQMQDSKRVKLDGFGSFKIGLNSKGARTAKSFTVADHIEGMHVLSLPHKKAPSIACHTPTFRWEKKRGLFDATSSFHHLLWIRMFIPVLTFGAVTRPCVELGIGILDAGCLWICQVTGP